MIGHTSLMMAGNKTLCVEIGVHGYLVAERMPTPDTVGCTILYWDIFTAI